MGDQGGVGWEFALNLDIKVVSKVTGDVSAGKLYKVR